MIENRVDLLDEMMVDMELASALYRPGNYWQPYVSRIYDDLRTADLNMFRSGHSGPQTKGAFSSFHGGSPHNVYFGERFYPFDEKYEKIDSSLPVRLMNRIFDILSTVWQPLGAFSPKRVSLGKRYYLDAHRRVEALMFQVAEMLDCDNTLDRVEDSPEGNPVLFTHGGKYYSDLFIEMFLEYLYMKQYVDFSNISRVLEIGPGFGMLPAILLGAHPHLKLLLVDIPPPLYVTQQYLDSLFPGQVLKYSEAKKLDSIDGRVLDEHSIVCLAPWDIERLANESCDLFCNIGSFQEMEPNIVLNYLTHVRRCTTTWSYINNALHGHVRAAGPGTFGVLEQTNRDHYLQAFSEPWDLVDERATRVLGPSKPDNPRWQMMFRRRVTTIGRAE